MKLVVCPTPIKHGHKSQELNIYFVNEIGCLLYTNKTWTQKSRIVADLIWVGTLRPALIENRQKI